MKRVWKSMLVLLLVLCLTACGGTPGGGEEGPPESPDDTATSAPPSDHNSDSSLGGTYWTAVQHESYNEAFDRTEVSQMPTERPANESQVGISRFQVRKKATRNQTAERSKIETAVGQRGVQYEIRSAPVCLDKQLPRRSRYAGTYWQKPSCKPCKAFLQNAFCP